MRGGYVAVARRDRTITQATLTITPEAGRRTRTEVRAPRILGDQGPNGWHPARIEQFSVTAAVGTGR